ncbi:hypothetical protein [Ideonella paludis]|uniref:Uncharacterized protein n=1 Tax=Ideonella paludis TaxID=1233411 RepID=A0ABS5DT34_9BURK|nr:hypothetical protein [Ideonella paludis]MBQ0934293.1 hypothetical protein [Ideonella paludis]
MGTVTRAWVRVGVLVGLAFGGHVAAFAAEQSCKAEIGHKAAQKLVQRCIFVSPATNPPCHANNPCALIQEEIARGCAYLAQEKDAPAYCRAKPANPAQHP